MYIYTPFIFCTIGKKWRRGNIYTNVSHTCIRTHIFHLLYYWREVTKRTHVHLYTFHLLHYWQEVKSRTPRLASRLLAPVAHQIYIYIHNIQNTLTPAPVTLIDRKQKIQLTPTPDSLLPAPVTKNRKTKTMQKTLALSLLLKTTGTVACFPLS